MKKIIRTLIAVGLMLSVCTWTIYADDNSHQKSAVKPAMLSVSLFPGSIIPGSPVHEQAYLSYLVKEYSPDSLKNWEKAFAERNETVKNVQETTNLSASSLSVRSLSPRVGAFTWKSEDSIGSANETTNETVTTTITTKASVWSSSALPDKIDLAVARPEVIHIVKEIPAELKAKAELYQKFEKAVAAGDAEEIKSLLPELLKDYTATTEQMKNIEIYFTEKTHPVQE